MRAMVLDQPGKPLRAAEVPRPRPGPGEAVLQVLACGVCRTDLHIVDGELPSLGRAVVPGHEVVGRVVEIGSGVSGLSLGQRVGVPWLGHSCGQCRYCLADAEDLCDVPRFTGYHYDGGYADFVRAEAAFCLPLPAGYGDVEVAPLLCAGLIGYRSLSMAGDALNVGLYGFGAAAHVITQVAVAQGRRIHAFTREGDSRGQGFARDLGAVWAGSSEQMPPEGLDAAILFAPVGALVPAALKAVRKGGKVICGGIHMSDIPSFPYRLLWEERQIVSVANLTRRDGRDFLREAERIPMRIRTTTYPLEQANEALADLRNGRFEGAAVLVP